MAARALGREVEKRTTVFGKKVRLILIICYIKLAPIVKTGAL